MTTEQKKKAIQAGTHLLENDGKEYEWNLCCKVCSPYQNIAYYSHQRKYFGINNEFVNLFDVNPDNLPTIKASRFFIDEPNEPMINISLTRLEGIAQELVDKLKTQNIGELSKSDIRMGVYKLRDLLKLEAK